LKLRWARARRRGPGAGKTFCLIARIQHLINTGIDPHRICAVTFTNRAAEEIAMRLKQALGTRPTP